MAARHADTGWVTEHAHRPSILAPLLLAVGALATLGGGLGVGFRAAGLGYLGQSLAALALGVVALWGGAQLELRSRRSLLTPVAAPSAGAMALFSPQPQIRWSRPEPATFAEPEPARVRVVAWHEPCRELGTAA